MLVAVPDVLRRAPRRPPALDVVDGRRPRRDDAQADDTAARALLAGRVGAALASKDRRRALFVAVLAYASALVVSSRDAFLRLPSPFSLPSIPPCDAAKQNDR